MTHRDRFSITLPVAMRQAHLGDATCATVDYKFLSTSGRILDVFPEESPHRQTDDIFVLQRCIHG